MSEIICPHCQKKIAPEGRHCMICGGDLENEILKHKQRNLPVKFQTDQEENRIEYKREELKANLIVLTWLISGLVLIALAILLLVLDMREIWIYILLGIFGLGSILTTPYMRKIQKDERSTWFKCVEIMNCCGGCCDCM